jgi:hypothetical protein
VTVSCDCSECRRLYSCDGCSVLLAGREREAGKLLLCVACTSIRANPRGIESPLAMQERLAVDQRFTCTGKFRVYFNRHGAEPLMWCISPELGGWEIAVRDVQLATIAESVYRKKETADEDDGRPSAWFAIEGVLTVNAAGFATIGSP